MRRKLKIVLVVVVSVALVFVGFVLYASNFLYQFEIVSDNGVLGMPVVGYEQHGSPPYNYSLPMYGYNYTVYVEIKHVVGSSNSVTMYCELTRQDLTKVTKSQTVTVSVGESRIVQFFFSNDDLLGKIPVQYRVHS